MRFRCQAAQAPGGGWTLCHSSSELGVIEVRASTREEAQEKMRGEIRYRLELCPCSGESYQHVEIELGE
jgi:hypothetical protein